MDFTSLGKRSSAKTPKKDLPVNIAMRLDHIEIGNNAPSVFHGFTIDTNEPIQVRMMTIDEGVLVNGRQGEDLDKVKERLQSQYAGTGEKHRPRPAEIANPTHKTHCQSGGLLMFTKCLKNDDGSYRAHWVETLERTAGAGCDKVMANIRAEDIREDGKVTGFQVVADVVSPDAAVMLSKKNLVASLTSAFANQSGEEKRKPFVFVRLVNGETGEVVLPPARANAKYDSSKESDPDSGQEFTTWTAAPAEDSVKNLFNPENVTQDAMVIRAALFGLGDKPGYPEYKGVDNKDMLADLNKITDLVRSGDLKVEMVPGERIGAGPATRASIEKAVKGNPHHPVNTAYTKRKENGFVSERRFCPTYLTTMIGKDGHRFFTKAIPADLYPALQVMKNLATVNDHKAAVKAAQERAAEANVTDVDVDEGMALDPAAMDGLPEDLDERLSQSAQALEAGMV